MPYARDSIEAGLLRNEPECLAEVSGWIGDVLASSRFWRLRPEWRDLRQEVLLRVVESLRKERFDPGRDFRAYVRGVTRFTALHALSLRRREAAAADAPPSATNPGDADNRILSIQLLRVALDSVSEECRRLILAYFLKEKSYAEIAAETSMPVGTVKSRLFRCLERIRTRMAGSKGLERT